MVVIHETARVKGHVSKVFNYVADFENSEKWDPGVDTAKKVSAEPGIGLGTEYDVVALFKGNKTPMRFVLLRR